MPRCGPGRLDRYGESMVRSQAGCADRVARPAGDLARMLVGDSAKLDSGMTQRVRNDVTPA